MYKFFTPLDILENILLPLPILEKLFVILPVILENPFDICPEIALKPFPTLTPICPILLTNVLNTPVPCVAAMFVNPALNPDNAYGIAIDKAIVPRGPSFLFILATPLITALPTFAIPFAIPLVILLTGFFTAFVTFLNTFLTLPIILPIVYF